MFSEQTATIETHDIIPFDSDFHGEGPCKMWAPGIDRVFSSKAIKIQLAKKPSQKEGFGFVHVLWLMKSDG